MKRVWALDVLECNFPGYVQGIGRNRTGYVENVQATCARSGAPFRRIHPRPAS